MVAALRSGPIAASRSADVGDNQSIVRSIELPANTVWGEPGAPGRPGKRHSAAVRHRLGRCGSQRRCAGEATSLGPRRGWRERCLQRRSHRRSRPAGAAANARPRATGSLRPRTTCSQTFGHTAMCSRNQAMMTPPNPGLIDAAVPMSTLLIPVRHLSSSPARNRPRHCASAALRHRACRRYHARRQPLPNAAYRIGKRSIA